MPVYSPPPKELLLTLYGQGKSMQELAITLHCSLHTVAYWMDKYRIPRRTRSDAAYIKANPHGDPFTIKQTRTKKEERLYGLGLGIYWGEGNKASTNTVRVTNTDPEMIKVFRTFLFEICDVHPEKIRYSLVTFNDTKSATAAEYWCRHLEISADRFGTIVSIPPQGKGSYKKKSEFGVCTITVSNTKLKQWMLKQLEEVSKNARLV